MSNDDLLYRSALSLAAAIKAREVSPVELLEATLHRADEVNDRLNALIWRNDDEALAAAKRAEEAVVHSDAEELPPFHGMPIPIKDLTEVAGWPVTFGSWAAPSGNSAGRANWSSRHSGRRASCSRAGRTRPSSAPSPLPRTCATGSPATPGTWPVARAGPAGSGGGHGGRDFSAAHGNDGAGSIRIPASCCGLVGLKVSRGRVPSRYRPWEGGAVQGVVTRDVADTAAILDVICGPDNGQWYNAPAPERPFLAEAGAAPGRPDRLGRRSSLWVTR